MKVFAHPWTTTGFLAALLTTLITAGCDGPAMFRDTRTAQVAHVASSPVKVVTENGSVDIAREDTAEVRITAHVRAQSQERLEATSISVVRTEAGQLNVGVDWPGGLRRGSEGCDFEIRLPDAVGIEIDSSNGRITLAGLSGRAELTTSNGDIDIRGHDGPVRAHTSNGGVDVEKVNGDLVARSTNGSLKLKGVAGKADATTSNGNIDIELEGGSPGPVFADTSNGSVTVEAGPAFAGRVLMRTSNGEIKVTGAQATGSKHSKSAVVGTGGVESVLKTSNGGIRFRVSGERPRGDSGG